MSITIDNQDNVGEHLLEKFLRYKQLIQTGKISKEYIGDGIKMEVNFDEVEDVDWHIILEEMHDKQHPLRDLRLWWKSGDNEQIKPYFNQLAKMIGAHTMLVNFRLNIQSISRDNKTAVIFEALKDNHSIKHLWVNSMNFDLETAHVFMKTLTNNQSLLSLNFSAFGRARYDTPMQYECVVELARLLSTTVLQRLKIYKITKESLKVLVQSLPKTLLHLDLSRNNIDRDSIPILQSYLKSNGNNLKLLILDGNLMTQILKHEDLSSLSTVKIVSSFSWHADLFCKEEAHLIKPYTLNDSDWSILFMELATDGTIYREIVLCFHEESDQDHWNYVKTLLGTQFRVTNVTISGFQLNKSIQAELFRLLKENSSITKLKLQDDMDSNILCELVNVLANNHNIIHLELSNCGSNMSDKEAIILAEGLKTNIVLQSLALHQCEIGDTGFQSLLSSLSHSLSQLKVEDSLITGKSLPSLLVFIKTRPMLKELSLKKNGITISSAPDLNVPDIVEQILRISNANHCICELEINTKIKDRIAISTTGYINLYSQQIRDYDMLELYNELKKEPNRNWSLNLVSNYKISLVGYRYLSDILSSGISIVKLSMGFNEMKKEAQAHLLNGLCNNKKLESFRTDSNKFNHQDIVYIASLIKNSPTLKILELCECGIDPNDSIHLSKVLPKSSLQLLNLERNLLDDRACATILSSIPSTLIKLSLRSNQITESSLQTFLTFFATNQTLKQLDIYFNPIYDMTTAEGDNCIQQLNEAAKQYNICELCQIY